MRHDRIAAMSESWRARRRRLALGLPTVLGAEPRGFFIPYRYAATLPDAASLPVYEAIGDLFESERGAFARILDDLTIYGDAFAAILAESTADAAPGTPRFDQDWFPTLDAAIAYRMTRALRPRRIVEIGSGHSTRFMARAIADGGLTTTLTAIDPAPRAAIASLAIEHVADTVPPQRGDDDAVMRFGVRHALTQLEAGDVLFIDSSHILMPGNDVDYLFNRVLPALPAGTIVQIHDVMLPDPYPAAWTWRGYNEQNALLPWLAGGTFRPLFSSHYATTRMADAVAGSAVARLPVVPGAIPGSLWLEKVQG
jgi:predicted O-methyltransferase YrrM